MFNSDSAQGDLNGFLDAGSHIKVHIVTHINHWQIRLPAHSIEMSKDSGTACLVYICQRLVQQQHLWRAEQGSGDGHPLLLPAGLSGLLPMALKSFNLIQSGYLTCLMFLTLREYLYFLRVTCGATVASGMSGGNTSLILNKVVLWG